jgi:DNA transformation protein and related proteins
MIATNDLERLPNLGPVLARELRAAGVETPAQLPKIGARAAWAKVREVNPERDCASSLLALEGAVRGVRWMSIDPAERRRLSAYAEQHRLP